MPINLNVSLSTYLPINSIITPSSPVFQSCSTCCLLILQVLLKRCIRLNPPLPSWSQNLYCYYLCWMHWTLISTPDLTLRKPIRAVLRGGKNFLTKLGNKSKAALPWTQHHFTTKGALFKICVTQGMVTISTTNERSRLGIIKQKWGLSNLETSPK